MPPLASHHYGRRPPSSSGPTSPTRSSGSAPLLPRPPSPPPSTRHPFLSFLLATECPTPLRPFLPASPPMRRCGRAIPPCSTLPPVSSAPGAAPPVQLRRPPPMKNEGGFFGFSTEAVLNITVW
uniref:Uncharacterized protein n=1 Tax=Setaria viridis TaxID=4556 RepID=A0A4U6TMH1_SETVI|nr:hypothetical protein SEVIR_7G041800v2 [Setaria viridis]